MGEGKKDAFFTIIGGLAGALVYAFVYPVIKPLLIDPLNYGKITFADVLSIPPIAAAAVFAVILAVTAYLLPNAKAEN